MRVPVEHRPLETSAASLQRDGGQSPQQRLAATGPAIRWPYEEVLEPQTRSAEERREIKEKQGKSGDFGIILRQQHLGVRMRAEQRLGDIVLACDAKVPEPLEFRELPNQREHLRKVGARWRAQNKWTAHQHRRQRGNRARRNRP